MEQQEFFPRSSVPRGFRYIPEFIDRQEEGELLGHIRGLRSWKHFTMHGVQAKRKVIHYGLDYDLNSRAIKKAEPVPKFLVALQKRVAVTLKVPLADISEVLLTHYPPGAPIGWHLDAPMFESLLGVSLLASCVLKLRHATAEGFETYKKVLEPRSAYLITGVARWRWQHHIPPVKSDRYSITFRTLRKNSQVPDYEL